MNIKSIHFYSGIIISLFVGIHLFNHCYSLISEEAHIDLMNNLRVVYRNTVVETLLLLAVAVQIFSGIQLFLKKRKLQSSTFEKLQIFSGLYLGFFLIIHVSAILAGRFILNLDTNFYYGVAGLNTFPFNLFFIPYYGLAVISFFGHIAAIHSFKMRNRVLGLTSEKQAIIILILGIVLSIILLYGLTNGFKGVEIPKEYHLIPES